MGRTAGITLFFLLASTLAFAQSSPKSQPEYVPGQIIVKYRSAVSPSALPLTRQRISSLKDLQAGRHILNLQDHSPEAIFEAIEELKNNPDVEYAEPNYLRYPFRVPNDTYYPLQWHLKTIKAEQGWDITTGDAQVIVAIIDTGILPNHPDLIGRLLPGYDFISDSSNANDGSGWDSDPTDNGTDSLESSAFHGTHIAGIIGAQSNNEKGVAGVNWACKILPVRALGVQKGKGADADIAAAIRWAGGLRVTNAPDNPYPAKIISLSFGGPGFSKTLDAAITDVINNGVIVVAAAGNQNSDAKEIYPAATEGVIAVGATQLDGTRAGYSNFGDVVAIMAPGGNLQQNLPEQFDGKDWPAGILSTLYRTETQSYAYHVFEGTSQAAPIVSGVVSLMVAIKPTLTNVEAKKILRGSADPRYRCNEGCGSGMVDVANALTYLKTGNLLSNKLSFGDWCEWDSQCSEGTCQSISSSMKICTHECSSSAMCPNGANCQNNLCVPISVAQGNSVNNQVACANADQPCEVVGVSGCSFNGQPFSFSSRSWFAIIFFAFLLVSIRQVFRRSL